MTKQHSQKFRTILGMDIGGTKIAAQLFALDDHGGVSADAVWHQEPATERGFSPHIAQVASIIQAAHRFAQSNSMFLAVIGIGSPGRFDDQGNIRAGTHENMSFKAGEFNHKNLRQEYARALKSHSSLWTDARPKADTIPLYVGNDGNAMLAGMLEKILKSGLTDKSGAFMPPDHFHDKTVAVFGIGTGLGHAIAKRDPVSKEFGFVTDGHASRLLVTVDDADLKALKGAEAILSAKTGKQELRHGRDAEGQAVPNRIQAEDLFRGPIIEALAGFAGNARIDAGDAKHAKALAFAGKYMARTIALIHGGEGTDIVRENEWSKEHKKHASGTDVYLIGGGMGSSPVGREIIRHAEVELEKIGLHHIEIHQVEDNKLAARAAAMTVPQSVRRGTVNVSLGSV